MTLVVAGGLGPRNIGRNLLALGSSGRMFLAGTSVYSHPAGPGSGVRALRAAWRAYREQGITEERELREYAAGQDPDRRALAESLT
jgi:ribulose 1,5-bisphosphate carboxylase large subunit-like protein